MGSDHRGRRRKQLASHPGLVEQIVGPPTRQVESMLSAMIGQPITPGRVRMVTAAGRRLHEALASLCGDRSKAARRARHVFDKVLDFTTLGSRSAPHLKHTPATAAPWPGWRKDLASLSTAYPDHGYAVRDDIDFLGQIEASIAADTAMTQRLAALIRDARAALPYCTPRQAAALRPRLDALVEQHASFAAMLQPSLATMAPAGSA